MDADFVLDPFDETTGKTVGDAIGAEADFASQFGYYADIVRPIGCENFPPGWEDRLIPLEGVPNVFCLEPHDMAAAKFCPVTPLSVVAEETSLLNEIGNACWHHFPPGLIPGRDVFQGIPRKDVQVGRIVIIQPHKAAPVGQVAIKLL